MVRSSLWMSLAALVAAGCGQDPPASRFAPPPETARHALEAALRSWQEGRPAGKIEGQTSPDVFLVNNSRRPGQALVGFKILGETAGEGPRCFAVRLRLENPAEEQRVRFVVMGIDPLWVYRYEDFEMMIHWQCGSEEKSEKADPPAKKNSEDTHAAH